MTPLHIMVLCHVWIHLYLFLGQPVSESHQLEAQKGDLRITPSKINYEATGCSKDW